MQYLEFVVCSECSKALSLWDIQCSLYIRTGVYLFMWLQLQVASDTVADVNFSWQQTKLPSKTVFVSGQSGGRFYILGV